MFCSNCGAQIVGNGKFCASCGTPVPGSVSATPQAYTNTPTSASSYAAAPRGTTAQPERKWNDVFREGWRSFFGAPLAIATLICYTAVQVLNLFSMNSALVSMESMLDSVGVRSSDISAIQSSTSVVSFLSMIPGVLMLVGMWMVYADTKSHVTKPIKTTGLSIIKGLQCYSVGILVIALIFILVTFGSVEDNLGHRAADALGPAKAVIIIVVLVCCAFYGFVIYALNMMRTTAEECVPVGTGAALGIGVLSIIFGGLSFIGVLGMGFNLTGLAGSAASILLGVVLCQYKSKMDELVYVREAQYTRRKSIVASVGAYPTGNAPGNTAGIAPKAGEYVPAWKRVQMGQVQSAQAAQQTARTEVTAKMCPECGTTQSGDNNVCFYCGADL